MKDHPGELPLAGARLGRLLLKHRSLVVALDQMALSLFNFLFNLVLLRLLAPAELGQFSLWNAVSLLAIGMQNALVGMPLNVYVPAGGDAARVSLLERSIGTVNFVLAAAIVALVVAVNAAVSANWAPHGLALSCVIPAFIAATLAREYYRSAAFGRGDMVMLVLTDAPSLAVTALGVGVMLVPQLRASGLVEAFLAVALGWAAAQLSLWSRPSGRPQRPFPPGWVASYRAIGGDVSWSLAGVFATNAVTRSYVYLATALAGLPALAALNAVGVLFRPVSVLTTAWSRLALPRMAVALAAGGHVEFRRSLWRALALASLGSIAWTGLLWAAWVPIERHLLAGRYPEASLLLLSWALASTVTVLESIVGVALNAAREFRFLAWMQVFGGVLSIGSTAALILWQGYLATMYGTAIGGAACLAAGLFRLRTVCRRGTTTMSGAVGLAAAAAAIEGN